MDGECKSQGPLLLMRIASQQRAAGDLHGSCSQQNASPGISMSSPGWQTRFHSFPTAVGTQAQEHCHHVSHELPSLTRATVLRLTPEEECVTAALLLLLLDVGQDWPLSWCRWPQEKQGWQPVVHQQEQSLLLQQKGSKDETCKPLISVVSY